VVQECQTNPFGDPPTCTSSSFYQGVFGELWFDSASDTYHTPNREYSPTEGRWLTPDPAGLAASDPTNPQSWNRYAYVLNSPIAMTDPSGLLPTAPNGGCPQGNVNPLGGTCNWWQGLDPIPGGGCAASIDGGSAPCSLLGGSDSYTACPNGDCSVFNQMGKYQIWPGVNGPVWENTTASEELTVSEARELGLTPLGFDYSLGSLAANKGPYLSVTSDYCNAMGRTITYKLNGAKGYVWEILTYSNKSVDNNTKSATLNWFPDFISGYGIQLPFSQRFVMSPTLPKPGTQGTPVQIQQNSGGWNVLLDSQMVQRTNGNIYVGNKPCPE